jgi:hypothetical protein
MKAKVNLQDIKEFAQANNAVNFENWCKKNKVATQWLDIDNIMDINDGYYSVQLADYNQTVLYCDGKLLEIG